MSNNTKKLINKIIMILICCIILFSLSCVYASPQGSINPDNYKPPTLTTDDAQPAMDKIKPIIEIITGIGIAVSVIALILLGIKYMVGSIEEKAEYKKSMIPYLIGAIMIFLISTIVTIIMEFSKELFPIT